MIAAYVPRFYGTRVEEILSAAVTEAEARLAVARSMGFSSWEMLLDLGLSDPRQRAGPLETDPIRNAARAIEAMDLIELQGVAQNYPDLLHPSDFDVARGRSLFRYAIHHERVQGREAMRPIMDWLAMKGFDLQLELNRQLCGHMYMKSDKVRWLLDRGADPAWIPPNGIPVLEHALIRYWNGEAVDLVAARSAPRKALWISAGLGHVNGVSGFLDGNGKPTAAACRLRPDFDAVGPRGVLPHPDPDDEEVLMEAFFIAMLNGRTTVLEYMVSRGFPVNSLVWGTPVISVAVGNAWIPVIECLLRCGADLDLTGWGTRHSARDNARAIFEDNPHDIARRRVVELCGIEPESVLSERDERASSAKAEPETGQ